MKKHNWLLGVVVSGFIALIASFPKLFRSEVIIWTNFFNTIFYTFFFGLLAWIIHTALINSKVFRQSSKNKLGISLMLILIVGTISYGYDYLFSIISTHPLQFNEVPNSRKIAVILLRGFIISGLFYFIVYYLFILEEKQKALIEIEYLKQAQLQANISSLKEQLSPHFLFNTLNTLTTLTTEQNVKEYVVELANVYRYVLQFQNKDLVNLKQEIDFVVSYLFILKTRLENALEINININEEIFKSQLPPLTIQILVENIIKHNVAAEYKPLQIKIYNVSDLELVIENNYQPKSSITTSTGTGLDNISKRYRFLFQKEIEITQNDGFFIVKLPIIQ